MYCDTPWLYVVLCLLWDAILCSALKKQYYSNVGGTLLSSRTSGSLLECLAWAEAVVSAASSTLYDQELKQCKSYNIMPSEIYSAISSPSPVGDPYYISADCIPDICNSPGEIYDKPAAFPSGLHTYMPLSTSSGTLMDIYYYTTPSLVENAGSVNVPVWDKPFYDDTYPLWTSDTWTTLSTGYNPSPEITFQSVAVFAWINIGTNLEKKSLPILLFAKSGIWNKGIALGAGNPTIGDKLTFVFMDSSTTSHLVASDEAVIKRGTWQHIGGQYDSNTGQASIFLNGENIKSVTFPTGLQTSPLDGVRLHSGSTTDGATLLPAPFTCQDCASIHHEVYNRALNNAEVKQIYQRFLCRVPGGSCPVQAEGTYQEL